ncbi:MAG: isoaspartyl peptidase/L-asparaginase [Betaproteobacteria bacterium]|nr:isoaspartyl peptidase/L-asparaginase [Betaproteobacteria bacterium]
MKRFVAFLAMTAALTTAAQDKPFAIAIHGGSGTITRTTLSPEREAAYRTVLTEALEAGRKVLAANGTSLDAVVAAVKIMEDSPLFNAGKGAVFTHEGTNEMDASIMDGNGRRAGAVAGVTVVKNPIEAARAVMDKSRHVMMAGKGAELFAKDQGLAIVDPKYFWTQERWDQLQKAKERDRIQLDHDAPRKTSEVAENEKLGAVGAVAEDEKFGTVGAVALDKAGNLAAATSTGGLTNKRFGRVGDSPIVGAGTWAENESVAVSATGTGEMFIRGVAAYDIAARVKYKGASPQQAADDALVTVKSLGGRGGVIVLDRTGHAVFSFTTEGMYRGVAKGEAKPEVLIYR